MTKQITNYEDVFDSRDVLERIEELENNIEGCQDDIENETDEGIAGSYAEEMAEYQDELDLLNSIKDQYYDDSEFEFGVIFIRDSYFEEYAQELAEDIGAIDRNANWPLTYIDWESASEALKIDYCDIDFDGVTYWAR